MKKRFLYNSFSGVIQTVVSAVLIFLTFPYFINAFGSDIYGAFSLIMILSNVNILITFGVNNSLIKFLAEQGKSIESNYDIIASLIILSLIIVPITLILTIYHQIFLISVLKIPRSILSSGLIPLYIMVVISNALFFFGQIFSGILDARQEIYLSNFIQSAYSICYWLSILVVSIFFKDLVLVGALILASTILWLLLLIVIVKKRWGKLELPHLSGNLRRVIIKQLSYGYKLSLSTIISALFEPFSKILISHFVGVTQVGFYDIAIRVRNQLWNISSKVLYPLLPYFANVTDIEKTGRIIKKTEQKLIQIVLPFATILFYWMSGIVNVWIGTNVDSITLSIRFILAVYFLSIIVLPTYYYLMVRGYQGRTVLIQTSNVVVNIGVFFILLPIAGYYAILFSNLISGLVALAICQYTSNKIFNINIWDKYLSKAKLIFIFFIINIISCLIYIFLTNVVTFIILYPIITGLLTLLLFRYLLIISENDIHLVLDKNSKLYSLAVKILIP